MSIYICALYMCMLTLILLQLSECWDPGRAYVWLTRVLPIPSRDWKQREHSIRWPKQWTMFEVFYVGIFPRIDRVVSIKLLLMASCYSEPRWITKTIKHALNYRNTANIKIFFCKLVLVVQFTSKMITESYIHREWNNDWMLYDNKYHE